MLVKEESFFFHFPSKEIFRDTASIYGEFVIRGVPK